MGQTTPENRLRESAEGGGPLERRVAALEAEIARLKADVASLKGDSPRGLSRRGRALLGLAYLALVAAGLSEAIGQPFGVTFLAVFCGAVFTSGLAIWWMTLWARRKEARAGQFTIGSLLFLTAFVAIYFSAISWLVSLLPRGPGRPPDGSVFVWAAVTMGVVALFSIPFVLFVADGLVWAAVWVVSHPRVRRLLQATPPRGGRRD
jgi:hypothetical protein